MFRIFSHLGFQDYGDYWRYNYETFEEDLEFKYTRDDLVNDVRSLYHEVLRSRPRQLNERQIGK